jgi:hypothetical protein
VEERRRNYDEVDMNLDMTLSPSHSATQGFYWVLTLHTFHTSYTVYLEANGRIRSNNKSKIQKPYVRLDNVDERNI